MSLTIYVFESGVSSVGGGGWTENGLRSFSFKTWSKSNIAYKLRFRFHNDDAYSLLHSSFDYTHNDSRGKETLTHSSILERSDLLIAL